MNTNATNTPPSNMSNNKTNVNCGGCGCLSLTIFIIIIWMAFTGRLVTLIDNLIKYTAQ